MQHQLLNYCSGKSIYDKSPLPTDLDIEINIKKLYVPCTSRGEEYRVISFDKPVKCSEVFQAILDFYNQELSKETIIELYEKYPKNAAIVGTWVLNDSEIKSKWKHIMGSLDVISDFKEVDDGYKLVLENLY